MKLLITSILFCFYICVFAQTRIESNSSPDFELYNTTALNTGVASRMFFKEGSYYTGGIATHGTAANTARMSFYTSASNNRDNLVERLTISNIGYIGIANNAPTHPLHLKHGGIGFTQESPSGEAKIGFYTSATSAYIQTHNNVPMHFATNNSISQMTLTTAGRFGIGTTTPVSKFEVKGKTTITQQAGEDAALELNGTIKVSGSNPAAFVVTAGADPHFIVIDHPASNGNPDAIILVTPRYAFGEPGFPGAVLVYYNHVNQRWTVYAAGMSLQGIYQDFDIMDCDGSCSGVSGVPTVDFALFTPGMKFNVLVIDK